MNNFEIFGNMVPSNRFKLFETNFNILKITLKNQVKVRAKQNIH
jgi:hypothetical protein